MPTSCSSKLDTSIDPPHQIEPSKISKFLSDWCTSSVLWILFFTFGGGEFDDLGFLILILVLVGGPSVSYALIKAIFRYMMGLDQVPNRHYFPLIP